METECAHHTEVSSPVEPRRCVSTLKPFLCFCGEMCTRRQIFTSSDLDLHYGQDEAVMQIFVRKCELLEGKLMGFGRKLALTGCVTLWGSFLQTTALAQGYCSTVTSSGLQLGCAQQLSFDSAIIVGRTTPSLFAESLLNLDPATAGNYDGIIFDADWLLASGDSTLRFTDSLLFNDIGFGNFENLFLGSARQDGNKTALALIALEEASQNNTNLSATLIFDRLTIENTDITVRNARRDNSSGSVQTGDVRFFVLGLNSSASSGGGLTLRNGSLTLQDSTQFLMAAPSGGEVFIRAETGDNFLSVGRNSVIDRPLSVVVDGGARLTFSGTTINPVADSSLTVGQGAHISLINGAIVDLTTGRESTLRPSTVSGGSVRLEGAGTELRLTAPTISDGSIAVAQGATLRIQEYNSNSSELNFVGNNTLSFETSDATVSGSPGRPNEVTISVGPGVTNISSATLMDVNAGLRAAFFEVDGGALNLSNYGGRSEFYDNVSTLSIDNGGVFIDTGPNFYNDLDGLTVNNATLRSHSVFGSLTGGSVNGLNASLSNSTLDIAGAPASSSFSPGLASLRIDAANLQFSGSNQVRIGISPAGECFLSGGSCVPGTTRYSGDLITNTGVYPSPSLSGFDSLFFVPIAVDANATSADYVSGGENGVYTVARHNQAAPAGVSYDASPRAPTASDLASAGSTIPANLLYTIVNDPVADDQVDIAFIDVGLINNPAITTAYRPQTTSSVVTNPNTGNQTTTTAVTTPNGNGATQTVTTTITAPGGGLISTNTVTNTLGPATGTKNTLNYGQLLSNSGNTLAHNGLPNVSTLHPEAYASFMTVALEQSDLRRNMVLSNANGRASGNGRVEGMAADGRNVWFDSGLTQGQVGANGGLAGFDYDLNQFSLGADVWTDNRSRVGAYLGHGSYSMTDHTTSTDTLDFSSDAFSIGSYGVMETPNWSFSGMSGVSWGDTDATRDAITGSGANRHTANYDHRTYEIAARAVYTSLPSRGGWHFAPEVGLGYARYEQDGFTESGDSATALAVDNATAESLIGSLGLNVTGPAFGGGLIPLGFIRYEHDFLAASDGTHDIDAAFATSPGISQTFVGTHRGENAISVGLGLATALNASVDASAGIVYQSNTNGEEFGGGFRVTWRF